MLREDNDQGEMTENPEENEAMHLEVDEPIVAVWIADNSNAYDWYVGFVDRIMDNHTVLVRYLKKSSRDGIRVNAPDEDIYPTFYSQILLKLNSVQYTSGRSIKVH